MTKVTVLGLEPKKEKELKPIEFLAYLMRASIDFNKTISKSDAPDCLKEIVLLPKPITYQFDLMLCTRKSGEQVYILGHFNDGIVE